MLRTFFFVVLALVANPSIAQTFEIVEILMVLKAQILKISWFRVLI